jgi:hypothetical protein
LRKSANISAVFPGAVNIKYMAKSYNLWETVVMGNKDAPKREKKKPAKKK